MKQDKDWIEFMRTALRDAEIAPPEDGWERLERVLSSEPVPAQTAPVRKPAWRIYWPRIAAAAAVVLIGTVVGDILLRPDMVLEQKGVVITRADEGNTAVGIPERLRQELSLPVETGTGTELRPGTSVPAPRLAVAAVKSDRGAVSQPVRDAAAGSAVPSAAAPSADTEKSAPAATDRVAVQDAAPAEAARTARSETRRSEKTAGVSDVRTDGAESRTFRVDRPRRPLSFSVSAGGGVSSGSAEAGSSPHPALMDAPTGGMTSMIGNGTEIVLLKNYDYRESTFRHHQPLSVAFTFAKEFSHGLSLESGINYTLLRSDVQAMLASEEAGQSLHFLGIPVRMNWRFLERGRFSLYIGAGGMVEKCVSAKLGSRSYSEPGVQWSLLAAAGAQYRLGRMVGLYFEPEGSYYLTETRLRTVRTDSPLTLTLRLGVRLSF